MRVAVLACSRRVRCCEEEWQAAQRAHLGRAGRLWCGWPWCVGTAGGRVSAGGVGVRAAPSATMRRAGDGRHTMRRGSYANCWTGERASGQLR
jgi:hypothetical protein